MRRAESPALPPCRRRGRSSPAPARRALAALAIALLGALLMPLPGHSGTASAGDAQEAGAVPIRSGMPLAEALLELGRRGLSIVFTSRLVPPTLLVAAEPVSSEPRALLEELLAPHGLVVRDGPRGSLFIERPLAGTAAPTGAHLAGIVRSRRGGAPVAGVLIEALESGLSTRSGSDGRFSFDHLPAGRLRLAASRPGYVVEQFEVTALADDEIADLDLRLQPAPFASDEIVVHPSRLELLAEEKTSVVQIGHDELDSLPHLGNDVLRALELLPGVTSNDLSAQFQVRGSRRDEVLVLLDGQELYEGFHLQDFDNALSVVTASNLSGVRLTTGAFPADYGDRMGGVLEMSTREPPVATHFRLGASLLALELEASQRPAGGAGHWLVSARRGLSGLAEKIVGQDQPEFWDLFARTGYQWGSAHSLRLYLLVAGDRLDLAEHADDEFKFQNTAYDTSYLWLTHQTLLSARLFVDSALSSSRSDRDRRTDEEDGDKRLRVVDRRETAVQAFHQTWNLDAGRGHYLKAGGSFRRFETEYDYDSERDFKNFLVLLRAEPRSGVWAFRGELVDEHTGLFVSDQMRPNQRLTLEFGLRYDRHTLLDSGRATPRVHAAWAASERSLLRASWGQYTQSQRTYELPVPDADLVIYPLERSEHLVVGFERRFAGSSPVAAESLRLELYRRDVRDPRPRYDNLLEPFDPFPEGEHDRYRIAPDASRAEGLELFLRGRAGRRARWWLGYARAASEDRIDGIDTPRLVDQRETLTLDLDLRPADGWSLNLAWQFHTGRPTTAIEVVSPAGAEPPSTAADAQKGGDDDLPDTGVPRYGKINGERLANYHRLDLRLGRTWKLERGEIALFLDVQNLYSRKNLAGFSVEIDDETDEIVLPPETWPGAFASIGLSWSF